MLSESWVAGPPCSTQPEDKAAAGRAKQRRAGPCGKSPPACHLHSLVLRSISVLVPGQRHVSAHGHVSAQTMGWSQKQLEQTQILATATWENSCRLLNLMTPFFL